jgi:hypothetical protein
MMSLRNTGVATQCIQLAEKLHSAIIQFDPSSAIPEAVPLKPNANRWLNSLNSLVQEIRRNDALCTTATGARRAETGAVISTLMSGMSETIDILSDTRHTLAADAAEKINKRIDLHWMSVALISAYLERYAGTAAMIASTRLIIVLKGVLEVHAFCSP